MISRRYCQYRKHADITSPTSNNNNQEGTVNTENTEIQFLLSYTGENGNDLLS